MELSEKEYLETYDASRYAHPSVTADILVFTIGSDYRLQILLVKRDGHPFKGKWAVPGGFLKEQEDPLEAAKRELEEETGVADVYLEQLYTFGTPHRDPRGWSISIGYIALVPQGQIRVSAGDDAADAALYNISMENWRLVFRGVDRLITLTENQLAFDHAKMIRMALQRLAGKVDYTDIVFTLLKDRHCFRLYEYQKIYEAVTGTKVTAQNFRRDFKKKYVSSGIVRELEGVTKKEAGDSGKPAGCYSYEGEERIG